MKLSLVNIWKGDHQEIPSCRLHWEVKTKRPWKKARELPFSVAAEEEWSRAPLLERFTFAAAAAPALHSQGAHPGAGSLALAHQPSVQLLTDL